MAITYNIFFPLFLIVTSVWCCEWGYVEKNGDCYFIKDLEFLQALIDNSMSGKNPPPDNLEQLNLGLQHWENGRLVEFCCSASTITDCRMDYSLAGNFPIEIGNLTELEHLNLASNELRGKIPSLLGNLKWLKTLELQNNQLSGELPKIISGWGVLEELNLSNNKLKGRIPTHLGKQESLKSINLSFNYFEGSIPITLLDNGNLELLYLHVNNLEGIIPEVVCERETLLDLLYYNNLFCPPYPECIKYIGKQSCGN